MCLGFHSSSSGFVASGWFD
uniref:Uncharacterized protein n=1 Tax=Arundo donax TaxID=35708 RepID=A0A0A9CLI4_ARUDO